MTGPLRDELGAIEAEVANAAPADAAHLLNRAGDLCLAAGEKERALAFYGRGIDANLHAGRFRAATGLCHKLLRVAPGAVRTRCTLAWLAIGRGDLGEIAREIEGYASAVATPGDRALAARHLALMADATDDPAARDTIATHLDRLGEPATAGLIRGAAGSRPRPSLEASVERDAARWRKVVTGALTGPHDP